jgi:hypothetical protein
MRVAGAIALTLACTFAIPSTAAEHVAGATEIHAAIGEQAEQVASERAVIERLLSRPEVREWAAKAGLDLERAQRGAAMLDGEELQRVASHARIADAQLAGGDSIVIGSTAIIIILLIIILIVVA